jgi:hypothetical protein
MTHTATRDEILNCSTAILQGYTATSDTLASYGVIGPVPGNVDAIYVQGHRHRNLAMVTRTGRTPVRGRGRQVRVRISFARDTGDAAGTLAFDAEHIGGVAPMSLFV